MLASKRLFESYCSCYLHWAKNSNSSFFLRRRFGAKIRIATRSGDERAFCYEMSFLRQEAVSGDYAGAQVSERTGALASMAGQGEGRKSRNVGGATNNQAAATTTIVGGGSGAFSLSPPCKKLR